MSNTIPPPLTMAYTPIISDPVSTTNKWLNKDRLLNWISLIVTGVINKMATQLANYFFLFWITWWLTCSLAKSLFYTTPMCVISVQIWSEMWGIRKSLYIPGKVSDSCWVMSEVLLLRGRGLSPPPSSSSPPHSDSWHSSTSDSQEKRRQIVRQGHKTKQKL